MVLTLLYSPSTLLNNLSKLSYSNLNLAHSGGMDGKTYTDHTGLMGNPLYQDDVGAMCFNPVKNFQIAQGHNSWYPRQHILHFDSGIIGGTSWSGRMIGVAEENLNAGNHPIVIKFETGNDADYFLGFNRATGPNSDNQQAHDKVTLYKVYGGDGFKYSHSNLKAMVGKGQTITITNWRKTGIELSIKVIDVNTSVSPGYADVQMTFGDQPTPPPTSVPTTSPSKQPSTSPSIRPTAPPTANPSKAPSSSPSKQPTAPPTEPPTVDNGIIAFDSGTEGGSSWSGTLTGAANYANNPNHQPTTVMLTTNDDSSWFVGLNNSEVTITKLQGGQYSLMGALTAGQSDTITNWRNSGLNLVVKVLKINTNANSEYADVDITLEAKPTASPTQLPTTPPTEEPTVSDLPYFDSLKMRVIMY